MRADGCGFAVGLILSMHKVMVSIQSTNRTEKKVLAASLSSDPSVGKIHSPKLLFSLVGWFWFGFSRQDFSCVVLAALELTLYTRLA